MCSDIVIIMIVDRPELDERERVQPVLRSSEHPGRRARVNGVSPERFIPPPEVGFGR